MSDFNINKAPATRPSKVLFYNQRFYIIKEEDEDYNWWCYRVHY